MQYVGPLESQLIQQLETIAKLAEEPTKLDDGSTPTRPGEAQRKTLNCEEADRMQPNVESVSEAADHGKRMMMVAPQAQQGLGAKSGR